jgi:hypothetical protein
VDGVFVVGEGDDVDEGVDEDDGGNAQIEA